jgi:adenylate kinase family enzyme
VFAAATAPLLAYYREQGLARVVDGTGSPDEVTAAILALATAEAS